MYFPRLDHCSVHCRCRVRFLCFHASWPYVSCTAYSPYADIQVCCTRDRLGFRYPSCLCRWLCPCLSDHRTCLFLHWGAVSAPSTSMGIWSAASERKRSITSALTYAQEFSLAELPHHVFLHLRYVSQTFRQHSTFHCVCHSFTAL